MGRLEVVDKISVMRNFVVLVRDGKVRDGFSGDMGMRKTRRERVSHTGRLSIMQ